jgi:tRNA pseudouridine13 synthase
VQWVRLMAKHKSTKGTKKWRAPWPKDVPDYLRFKILKENVDTLSAVNTACKVLRCKSDAFKFAGTKDKRAVTVQWAAVYRMKPAALCRLNTFRFPPVVRFGDFSYGKHR